MQKTLTITKPNDKTEKIYVHREKFKKKMPPAAPDFGVAWSVAVVVSGGTRADERRSGGEVRS